MFKIHWNILDGCIFISTGGLAKTLWKNTLVFKGNWWEEMTILIWQNLVTMTIQLESREIYLLPLEIWKKYNKWNSWIEISDKTVPKPKIKKWLKWFPKHSNSLFSMQILRLSVGEHKRGILFKKGTNLGVNYNSGNNTENKGVCWNRCSLKTRKISEQYI